MKIVYKQIGVIHSPFSEPKGVPIQPTSNNTAEGIVELFKEYQEGLKDLEGWLNKEIHKLANSEDDGRFL